MKHDTLRKLDRNLEIVEYHNKNPDKSLSEIARIFSLTRQRVFVILNNKRYHVKEESVK